MKDVKKLGSGVCELYNYSGINEFVEIARKKSDWRENRAKGDEWMFGTLDRQTTEEMLLKGIGLKDMRVQARKYREELEQSELREIRSQVKSVKRVRRNNDSDGDLNMDAVLGGSEEYWTRIERNGSQKVVRIAINCSISCGNGSEDFAKLVSLSAVFCEILEDLGYGVEIYCCFIAQPMNRKADWENMQFPIKNANEVLDVERIYSLGLQGLLRDVFFRVERVETGSHGGRCVTPPNDVLEFSNIDVIVEKTWTEGKQAERVIQAINSLNE